VVQINRLKELRLKNGYKTQQQLATALFVNQTAVSQWERGATVPSAPILRKLSQMYGVSIDYLLGLDAVSPETKEPATVYGDGPDPELWELLKRIPEDRMPEVERYLRFQAEKEEKP